MTMDSKRKAWLYYWTWCNDCQVVSGVIIFPHNAWAVSYNSEAFKTAEKSKQMWRVVQG